MGNTWPTMEVMNRVILGALAVVLAVAGWEPGQSAVPAEVRDASQHSNPSVDLVVDAQSVARGRPVPDAMFVRERIELEHGEFVLVRDDKLFLESTGIVVELEDRISAAKRGPAPGTILTMGEGDGGEVGGGIAVREGRTGKVLLKDDGRDAWVQDGVLHVLTKDRRKTKKGVRYVQFTDEVLELCIDDRGEIVVAVQGSSDDDSSVVFKNLRSGKSWIKLDSGGWDWFSPSGSKIVTDDTGVRWALLGTSRAGRGLGRLYKITGSEGGSGRPTTIQASGASVWCNDIWRNGKAVGGMFYRFNRDESREYFVCPDLTKGTCYKLDEGINEVWPNGDSWVYLQPAAGGLKVIRQGSLSDFSKKVDSDN